MNNTTSVLSGLVVGILIGVFVIPVFLNPDAETGQWGIMGGRGGISTSIDRHFIEEMIPHHDGAIAMAELALERSTRPEIKSLASGIIEAQTIENAQMREWYKEWFGTDIPTSSEGQMMGMMHGSVNYMSGMEGDMDVLTRAPDFDLEFIRQMISHHEMAIMMARMLAASTDRVEMQVLADQIITSQSREIEMMRSWAGEWTN